MNNKITSVIKRSGAIVPFKQERVINAIYRAAVAVGGRDKDKAEELAEQVVKILNEKFDEKTYPSYEFWCLWHQPRRTHTPPALLTWPIGSGYRLYPCQSLSPQT